MYLSLIHILSETGGPDSVALLDAYKNADAWTEMGHRNVLVYNGQMTITIEAGDKALDLDTMELVMDSADENTLSNWGFEEGQSGWTTSGNVEAASGNDADTGDKALRLDVYKRQDIAAEHRRNKKDFTGKSNGEYLSGFLKEDCIKPVITLVIHFGAEEWDGPLSLHEMMSVSDIEILSFVENYRIHLIDPAKLTEEQLNKFSTSMREVIGYIKYSKNKDKLLEFLRTDAHRSIEMNAEMCIRDRF